MHFLLRIEPFSGGFLDFQGGKFDVPDRSFHDIDQTWRLSSCVSFFFFFIFILYIYFYIFYIYFFIINYFCDYFYLFCFDVGKQSSSDVKELIPEFFVLPEFLVNKNRFDFGKKQNGQRVDDVLLPAWAKQNPRYLFLFFFLNFFYIFFLIF